MKIRLIAIGKIKNLSIQALVEDYQSRIAHDADLEVIEFKDSDIEQEGGRIVQALLKEQSRIIALSEEGREYSSQQFARGIVSAGEKLTFVIGGPFGLSEAVKARCGELLSLSRMTLTHEMARLLLHEQIYRAFSILHNRKYHKV